MTTAEALRLWLKADPLPPGSLALPGPGPALESVDLADGGGGTLELFTHPGAAVRLLVRTLPDGRTEYRQR